MQPPVKSASLLIPVKALFLFLILTLTQSCKCIVEGTLVETPWGPRKIDNVNVGDLLLSRAENGDIVPGKVTSITRHSASSFLVIETGDGRELRVTGSHPVFHKGRWVAARKLRSGDELLTQTGTTSITHVRRVSRDVSVYDISVAPHSNFFAGGVLVHNKSRDVSPHPSFLLKSGTLLAKDSRETVGLYRMPGLQMIRSFPIGDYITAMDISLNDNLLAVGQYRNSSATIWDVVSGTKRCEVRPNVDEPYILDISFSADGARFVLGQYSGAVSVYETDSGRLLCQMSLPAGIAQSAALSPDGSNGYVVTRRGDVYRFRVAEAILVKTAFTGGSPIRYSSTGEFVILQSHSGRMARELKSYKVKVRVVSSKDETDIQDFGQFEEINRIRPQKNGTVHITAVTKTAWDPTKRDPMTQTIVGLVFNPKTRELTQSWRYRIESNTSDVLAASDMDFDLKNMHGISVSSKYVISIYNLGSGKVMKQVKARTR